MLPLAFLFAMLVMACSKDDDATPFGAPNLNAASDITTNSFKATWSAVTGAEKYLLDVSTTANFSSTVTGYNKKEIQGTATTVNGLAASTKYYFRVYAKKGTTVSVNSVVKDATTK